MRRSKAGDKSPRSRGSSRADVQAIADRAEIEALRGAFRSSIQDMGRLTPMPRIYGRDAEIATLAEALDLAASGRLAVVLIEGEAGIGKSRLLEEALESARGRGIRVTAGRAEELQRTRPFSVVADAFGCVRSSPDPRRAAIARLLAGGGLGEREPITVAAACLPGVPFLRAHDRRGMGRCHRRT